MAFAVLLAAGSSSRFGSDKLQFAMADGRPLWRTPFDVLNRHPMISGVGVVCPKGRGRDFQIAEADFVVEGGATRKDSSLAGVSATPPSADIVLVHDAARPFLEASIIETIVFSASKHGAAIPVVSVTDSIARGDEWMEEVLNRDGLFRAQTPQGARREWLLDALARAEAAADEASALKAAGYPVKLERGSEQNVKITLPGDLRRPEAGIAVTGFGYDIHQFSEDPTRPLMLGGVRFLEGPGLRGHSDADVLLHAVTDALLGSCGQGDIGQLFPDTDPAWHGADSLVFLREAGRLVAQSGGSVANIDVTVLAEEPKLGKRREEIRALLSKELRVARSNINVKATTMEGLGAIGRKEGIAAMAVVTVVRPHSQFEV